MSAPDIESRLARLVPVDPPDPAGFAAARARVDDAVDPGTTRANGASTTGSPGPLADGAPDDLRARFSPDVVVPLPRRARRRRTLLIAAASIAVVGVLALVPGHAALERAEVAANQEALDRCLDGDDAGMAVVAVRRVDDEMLALLDDPDDPARVAFCSASTASTDVGRIGFTADDAWEPLDGPDDVTFGAVGSSRVADGDTDADGTDEQPSTYAYGFWGHAGDDVVSATLTTTSGRQIEAVVTQGYWFAPFLSSDRDGSFEDASLTWELRDGATRTAPLESLSDEE